MADELMRKKIKATNPEEDVLLQELDEALAAMTVQAELARALVNRLKTKETNEEARPPAATT